MVLFKLIFGKTNMDMDRLCSGEGGRKTLYIRIFIFFHFFLRRWTCGAKKAGMMLSVVMNFIVF